MSPAEQRPGMARDGRAINAFAGHEPPGGSEHGHPSGACCAMSGQNQFLLYTAPDGAVKVDVFFKDETVWLTQKALAELFGVKVPAVNKHLKNIFEAGELSREATISKMEIVRGEGDRQVAREVEFYNLDAIIAVGFRVNSYQATQFRIWATNTLREFIVKGFVLDDERLKQGKRVFGRSTASGRTRNTSRILTARSNASKASNHESPQVRRYGINRAKL